MLSEEFYSSICGPPLAANTAISKDVGIYCHSLTPSYAVKATFKKSATPANCLAVGTSHIFAAQNDKSQIYVYSKTRGTQEITATFPERIRSISLTGDVLAIGAADGSLTLWETCTGRQVTTPPCHVQAVSCLAATHHHVLTGSEDSNIHVWTLSRLLELDSTAELEPDLTLSHHRAAVTALAVNQSNNPETSICVSASRDKTCIVWNYRTGEALRTLLFPSAPLCLAIDPSCRAVVISTEDGSLYMVELFGKKPLVGPHSDEGSSTVVQVTSPFGVADPDNGPASCLAISHDGTVVLTGHTKGKILQWQLTSDRHATELTNLNASVTNLCFPGLLGPDPLAKPVSIIKPSLAERQYVFTSKLESSLPSKTQETFDTSLNALGFPTEVLERTVMHFAAPTPQAADDPGTQQQVDELWEIIHEQRALQKETLQKYLDAKSARS